MNDELYGRMIVLAFFVGAAGGAMMTMFLLMVG